MCVWNQNMLQIFEAETQQNIKVEWVKGKEIKGKKNFWDGLMSAENRLLALNVVGDKYNMFQNTNSLWIQFKLGTKDSL